jgi:hypothetical protein
VTSADRCFRKGSGAEGHDVMWKRRGKVKLLCAEMCEIYHGNLLYRMTLHDASLLSRDPTHLRH